MRRKTIIDKDFLSSISSQAVKATTGMPNNDLDYGKFQMVLVLAALKDVFKDLGVEVPYVLSEELISGRSQDRAEIEENETTQIDINY